MNKIFYVLLCLVCISCSKDDNTSLFSFKTGTGYISKDATVKYMASAKIGVLLESEPPFDFQITNNDKNVLDTTITNNYLNFDLTVVKTLESEERLKFTLIKDENIIQMLELDLERDTSVNAIDSFLIGSYMNDTLGSFYSISTKMVYNDSMAFKTQSSIDFIYYYDSDLGKPIMASPLAEIPSIFRAEYAPQIWGTRNQTLFCPIDLTINDFDELANDSVLIAGFDSNIATNDIELQENEVYLFKTFNEKYAIFKVIDIIGGSEGYLQLSVKIQK